MSGTKARCVCGHPKTAHTHYRFGSDCAHCGPRVCHRFRRQFWWRRVQVTAQAG